jgi:virulence factor Mce-like protein
VLQLVGAVAFVVALLSAESVRLPFTGGGEWTLRAAFADVGGIHTGERTPVLVAGVPSGMVTSVKLEQGVAVVTMRLDRAARGVIKADATATIEARSALQDLTVDISPGSAGAAPAPDGMRIAVARTTPTTTVDRVTAILDADTRAQLSIVVDQLARGLRGQGGRLRAAVNQLYGLLDPATRVAGALAQRRVILTALVDSLARVGGAVESRDASLAAALSAGSRTLGVTVRRQSAIAAAVSSMPSTISSLTGALARVRQLATPLVPALGGLAQTAAALPAALRSVRGATPAFASLLNTADAFATRSGASLHAAAGAFGLLQPTATALTPAIARLEPIVSAVNDHRQGIGQLGERFSGVLSTSDINGPILRGLGTFESFNPANFGFPAAGGAKRVALAAQAAEALTLSCLKGGLVACLVRYLIPGLPRSVR